MNTFNHSLCNKANPILWYIYLMPVPCIFGIVTNILNIIVFLNPRLKDSSYRFMLIISVSSLFYLLAMMVLFMFDCRNFGFMSCASLSKLYELYMGDYFTSCLAIFIIFIEIYLSIKRCMILSNYNKFQNISYKSLALLFFAASLLYYMPVVFLKDVIIIYNESDVNIKKYYLALNDFGSTYVGMAIPVILSSIRIFLATLFLSVVNILTTIKFKNRIIIKKRIIFVNSVKDCPNSSTEVVSQAVSNNAVNKNQEKANRNITFLVFWMSTVFVFGTAPYSVLVIVDQTVHLSYSVYLPWYNFTIFILMLTHGTNIFIYYYCNKLFKQILRNHFQQVTKLMFRSNTSSA